MISRVHSLIYLEQAMHADLLLCLVLSAVYSMQVQCIFAIKCLLSSLPQVFMHSILLKVNSALCVHCHYLSHNYS